jgi:predicted nuclease of predicted toxin-antitoxin system
MKFLADENLDNNILRGVLRRKPDLDLVRVQDVGLFGKDDPTVLSWAAQEERILLTHDVATITHYAYDRTAKNLRMPGVIEITASASLGKAIEDILLFIECGVDGELEGQILYLPF